MGSLYGPGIHMSVPDAVVHITKHGLDVMGIPSTVRCHCGREARAHHAIGIAQLWYDDSFTVIYVCPHGKQRRWLREMDGVAKVHMTKRYYTGGLCKYFPQVRESVLSQLEHEQEERNDG